jgi:hypothetical protein
MPTTTPTDRSWSAGVPEQWDHDFGVLAEGLIVGDVPLQFAEDLTVAYSQTLTAYMVVGFNASDEIVQATIADADPANWINAIGVLLYPVTTAGSGTKPAARVLRAGCINPDRLTWHASYNTAAKRMMAFQGAPSPTQIVMRPLAQHTPVLP